MPSTTNSLPGYSCGFVRMFSIGVPVRLETERFSDQPFERLAVALRGPDFELRVAAGVQVEQRVGTAIDEPDIRDGLGMAAVEAFAQPENARQRAHGTPPRTGEARVLVVPLVGRGPTVISRHERDHF